MGSVSSVHLSRTWRHRAVSIRFVHRRWFCWCSCSVLNLFFFFVVILRFLNILILSFFFYGKCKGLLYKTLSFSSRFSSKFQPGTISCLLHVSWSAKRQWRHHCDVKSLIISHLINLLSFNSKEKSFRSTTVSTLLIYNIFCTVYIFRVICTDFFLYWEGIFVYSLWEIKQQPFCFFEYMNYV